MLRWLVLALIVANIGFCSWQRGHLDDWVGARAQGDREPDRLNHQVRPETLRVVPAASAVAISSQDPPPTACLEAGPYTPVQVGAAEGALQAVLPPGSWANVKIETPAVWIVYMGRFVNRELLDKKIDELKRRKVTFEEVHSVPALDPGLSLGRYESRAAADKALADFNERGVRTARVETLAQPVVSHALRVERADATLQARLSGLRADALLGKPFAACASSR